MTTQSENHLRYAIYARYSTDMQQELSIEAQTEFCRKAAIVRHAFKMYSTGNYSDADIANWMQEQKVISVYCRGRRLNMNQEAVRAMLQNQVYTGRVCHSDTQYDGSLGERRKSSRHRKEWLEGKHAGFIPDWLFEACKAVRAKLASNFKTDKKHVYPLKNRVSVNHSFRV
jgi:hypothetical protein